jgi:hypothetical protein
VEPSAETTESEILLASKSFLDLITLGTFLSTMLGFGCLLQLLLELASGNSARLLNLFSRSSGTILTQLSHQPCG